MANFQTTLFSYAKLNLELTELSVDPANNKSLVRIRVYINGSYTYNSYPHTLKILINGKEYKSIDGLNYDLRKGSPIEWYNANWNILHTDDGKGTADVTAKVIAGTGNVEVSGSLALTPIEKEKSLEIQNTYLTLGEGVKVYPNLKQGEIGTLFIEINGKRTLVGENLGNEYIWVPSNDLVNQFSNASSVTANLILNIFDGHTNREEKITVQLNKPKNIIVDPIIGKITMKETNTRITNGIGNVWLSQQSKIQFMATAKGQYGATIHQATLIIENGSQQDIRPLKIEEGYVHTTIAALTRGTYSAYIEVVDSNGSLARTEKKSFVIEAYSPPRILETIAQRDSNNSKTINVSAKVANSHLSGKNTLTFKLFIKDGANGWRQLGNTQTSTNGMITYQHTLTDASEMQSYQIRFEASDELVDSVAAVLTVSTAVGLFDFFEGRSLGVGKMVDPSMPYNLTVASGGIQTDGNVETEGVLRIGRLTLSEGELRKLKELIS